MSPPASNAGSLSEEETSDSEDSSQSDPSTPKKISQTLDSEDNSKSNSSIPKKTSQRCPTENSQSDGLSALTDLDYDPATKSTPRPTSQPRPFPLSPPPLTQTLDASILPDPPLDDCTSDSDDLPTVVEMLAKIRPSQKSVRARNSTRSPAKNPASASSSKMDVDPRTPTRPLKRQPTESPRIPDLPATSTRKDYSVVKTPSGEYIEILTDTESPPPPPQGMHKGPKGRSLF